VFEAIVLAFDRLIIATALIDSGQLASIDGLFPQYLKLTNGLLST
jgi:PIN domain nuclease of toxin-antitoxin system